MKKILSNIFKYGLPVALSAWLCYYLYTKIDISVITAELKECNYWWIGIALVVSVFSHIFRAMRWGIQLDALKIHTPLAPLVWSVFGTYAINLLAPRLGELWRSGYIAKRESAPFTTVFGSMVCDRLADTAMVLLLTVFTFFIAKDAFVAFSEKYPQAYQGIEGVLHNPLFWAVCVAGVILLIWLFLSKSQNKWVLKTRAWIKDLWAGFAVVAKMPGKGRWIILTFAIWGCYFAQLYLQFQAFDFTIGLGFVCALVTFVLSSISMGIPSNGGLGPWHLAVIFSLGIYGVEFDRAAAFAMIVWGVQNAFIVLLGLYSFVSIALDGRKRSREIINQ